MRRPVIFATEGVAARVPREAYDDIAREGERIKDELGLKIGGVTRLDGKLRFDNMIGTISTTRGVIEIAPKTDPGRDWIRSVLDLMDDRPVVVFDDAPAAESQQNESFLEVVARTYSNRLSAALGAEGPITTIEPMFERSTMLNGRLRVSEWAVRASYEGNIFPVDHQVLTADNVYSQALTFVGQTLAPYIADPRVRRQLLDCNDALGRGREVQGAPPNALGLELPQQWGGYEPAWTIAQMVLKQRSRFGHRPEPYGMSLVIEPWILLERLLERAVKLLAAQCSTQDMPYASRPQAKTKFLVGTMEDANQRFLLPDCVLLRDDLPLVNFEAKYRDYGGAPLRNESYQAISAGRALGSSMAVLVYPNRLPGTVFDILKEGQAPCHLGVIGLDLFSYRRGSGDRERAGWIQSLLENAQGTYTIPKEGVAA